MSDERAIAYGKWLVQNADKKGSPEFETVATAYKQLRTGGETAAPAEEAVGTGDWDAVKQRVDAKEAETFNEKFQGPVRPEDISNVRQAEARRQGELYGKTYGAKEGGGEVFGRQAANTLGLGLPQLAEAYMPKFLGGQSALPGAEAHEFIKSSDAARGEQSPIASVAGTVAGIGGQIAAAPAGIPSIGGRLLGAAGGRVAGSAAVGAGLGGTEAAITSRGDIGDTATGAALGGAGGAAGGVLGEYVGSKLADRAGRKMANAIAPSSDDLARTASQSYKEAKDAGVWFKPDAYRGFVDDVKRTVSEAGVDETLHPKVMAAIKRLEAETGDGQAVTLDKLDLLRRVAGSAAKSKEPDEGRLASMIIDKLDDFVDSAGPGNVLFGDGQKGAQALQNARGAYAAKSRSARISEALDNADLGTSVTGSGANIDNKIRQAAQAIYKNKNAIRGFSPEEKEALRKVGEGTLTRNALRAVGKAAPSGIVSASGGVGLGALAGGPVGAVAVPAVGYAAKKMADRSTRKAMEAVDTMVRTRTVPGAQAKIAAAKAPENQTLARLIMTLIGANVSTAAGSALQ